MIILPIPARERPPTDKEKEETAKKVSLAIPTKIILDNQKKQPQTLRNLITNKLNAMKS